MKAWIAILAVVLNIGAAFAVQPDEILKDPVLEARARAISGELRCLVCQNQSIDDSDAPLAKDLRVLLRQQLSAGKTDTEVLDFIVFRYGEYVLLRPRLSGRTVILWSLPFVVLAVGAFFLFFRKKPETSAEQPLTAEEMAALERLDR